MSVPVTFRYTPGDATAVVGGGSVVMVALAPDHELVGALFAALQGYADVDDVLEVLLSPGLRAVASFGVARPQPGGTRVVVRGDFRATVSGAGAVVGEGLWRDSFLDDGARVVLGRGDPDSGISLPIVTGVVRAGAVVVQSGYESGPAEPNSMPSEAGLVPEEPGEPVSAADHHPPAPLPPAPLPTPPAPLPTPPAQLAPPATPSTADSSSSEPAFPRRFDPTPSLAADPSPRDGGVPAPRGLIEEVPWASGDAWLGRPDDWGSGAFSAASRPVPSPTQDPALPPHATFDAEAAEMTVNRRQLIDSRSGSGPLVIAARCPQGHISAAYAGYCRVCRQPLPAQQPFEAPRPPLGVLRLSTGDVVTLDRGAVLGRNPRLPSGFVGEQPNLVKLNDPGKDVSSQHLEVSLDFWHVLVKDLGSTNGTEVILPGEAPVQLHAHDAMAIEPGTRVVLAGVMDFVFEVTG